MSAGIIASQAFVPNKIPGLEVWLDASDVATVIESGGDVSQWTDKSNNGNHATQFTMTSQPQFLPSGISGKGAIDFTASPVRFLTLNSAIIATDLTAMAIFLGTATTENLILGGPAATNNQLLRFDPNVGANGALIVYDGVNVGQFDLAASIIGIPTVMTAEFDTGVGQKIYKNGVLGFTGSYDGTIAAQQIGRLLASPALGNFFLGEIIVYNRILNSAEKQALDNYMINKWGVV